MKSRITSLILIGLVLSLVPQLEADAGWRHKECRYGHLRGDHKVKATIRCAVEHYRVSGGKRKALSVARRESGFECKSRNPTSSAAGVFQVLRSTWGGWHRHLPRRWWHPRWELSHNRMNCRANVMVSIRMAHGGGWSPWGG